MPRYSLFPFSFLHNAYHFSLFFVGQVPLSISVSHTVGTQKILWDEWLRYECQVACSVYPKGPEELALGFKYLGVSFWLDVV